MDFVIASGLSYRVVIASRDYLLAENALLWNNSNFHFLSWITLLCFVSSKWFL